jgi:demethylmenaquinone methyltransferase / 2-methoxy-6-polyprenyl-1,4-benzoquinol methylase
VTSKNAIAEPSAHRSAAGARPQGSTGEQDAANRVREMFGRIAPRYDFLNHVLSLNIDRVWRRRVARRFADVLAGEDSVALDVCCGTGDLAFALARRAKGSVIASDFAHSMLVLASEKERSASHAAAPRGSVDFIEADGLNLPFADGSFDIVTLAFGFRNLASYDRGLREFARILRPGGELGILEFSEPRGKVFGSLYRWYFAHMLPRIGRMISGHDFAYSYLPDSVSRYLKPVELADHMTAAGFRDVKFESWTGGTVTFHRGTK